MLSLLHPKFVLWAFLSSLYCRSGLLNPWECLVKGKSREQNPRLFSLFEKGHEIFVVLANIM